MNEEELQKASELARTFEGLTPPNGARLIGQKIRGGDTYNYYKDDEGNYYFDSDRLRKFELEMINAKKKRRMAGTIRRR